MKPQSSNKLLQRDGAKFNRSTRRNASDWSSDTMHWCRANKRNGGRCGKHAMRESQYCYIHSFWKKAQISVWKRPETHVAIGVFATIVVAYVFYALGPTKENQNQMLTKQNRFEQKLDEMTVLMHRLGDKVSPEKLLAKYPLGYAIFELAYTNRVIPYEKRIIDKFDLNWKVVGFTRITSTEIELRLPDIISKDGKLGVSNVVTGGPKRVGNLGGAMVGELMVWGEVLDIRRDGIVFLVGFEQTPVPPAQPKMPKQ